MFKDSVHTSLNLQKSLPNKTVNRNRRCILVILNIDLIIHSYLYTMSELTCVPFLTSLRNLVHLLHFLERLFDYLGFVILYWHENDIAIMFP